MISFFSLTYYDNFYKGKTTICKYRPIHSDDDQSLKLHIGLCFLFLSQDTIKVLYAIKRQKIYYKLYMINCYCRKINH